MNKNVRFELPIFCCVRKISKQDNLCIGLNFLQNVLHVKAKDMGKLHSEKKKEREWKKQKRKKNFFDPIFEILKDISFFSLKGPLLYLI